jgi:hypothetical protein
VGEDHDQRRGRPPRDSRDRIGASRQLELDQADVWIQPDGGDDCACSVRHFVDDDESAGLERVAHAPAKDFL